MIVINIKIIEPSLGFRESKILDPLYYKHHFKIIKQSSCVLLSEEWHSLEYLFQRSR